MVAISLCKGHNHNKNCPKRDLCQRFKRMDEKDDHWQSWTHSPFIIKQNEFRCDMFLPIEDGEEN